MVTDKNGEIWLSTKEAAVYLELSVSRIYHIKNFLTHRKAPRLLFMKSRLLDDYMSIS